jgi:DNA polymerase III epsilon subunit-like protein
MNPNIYYHVIDVETTTFDPIKGDICELAVLSCRGREVYNIFHKYYSVDYMNIDAQNTHKLSIDMLSNWPKFNSECNIKELNNIFSVGRSIWGHNLPFDIRFLTKYGVCINNLYQKDTLKMLKGEGLKLENNKLTTWLNHYGIEISNHSALGDAFGTFQLITLKGWQLL